MNKITRNLLIILGIIVLVLSGIFFWKYFLYSDESDLDTSFSSARDDFQLIENDWVSFTAPEVLTDFPYQLDLDLLQPFEKISIVWTHPANVEKKSHTLKQFVPFSQKANYRISPDLGNILPGKNTYQIVAYQRSDQPIKATSSVSFDLIFNTTDWKEIFPEKMTFIDFPEVSNTEEQEVNGNLSVGADKLRVYSFHPSDGKVSYTYLTKYSPGDLSFRYVLREDLGNLFYGKNTYIFEAIDEFGEVYSRRIVSFQSDYLSLRDQILKKFGTFEKVKGGWFVSTRLPWFSIRPVYETVFFAEDDASVVVSRPTLMYSSESDRNTTLCDYLSSIDYKRDGYSYRGYSYETCQQYRFGVSVFDRFLSILKYKPVEVVKRIEYESIRDRASSAFVMIETGSMPQERALEISFDNSDENFSESESSDLIEDAVPRYYIIQMFLTDDLPYIEKKIGNIIEEGDKERVQAIEEIRALLSTHSADDLFSEILFTGVNAVEG